MKCVPFKIAIEEYDGRYARNCVENIPYVKNNCYFLGIIDLFIIICNNNNIYIHIVCVHTILYHEEINKIYGSGVFKRERLLRDVDGIRCEHFEKAILFIDLI